MGGYIQVQSTPKKGSVFTFAVQILKLETHSMKSDKMTDFAESTNYTSEIGIENRIN